jgi:type I restriction enzyme S subunit
MEWLEVRFQKALTDVTSGNEKIQKSDYKEKGLYPIIDQGQEYSVGYCDDENLLFKGKLPVIVFGDHTRIIKYVNEKFSIGADGVRVLKPKEYFEPKFIYYFLIYSDIPNKGYSRHFKFLKEKLFPLPPLSEQRRIVEILDQADEIRKLRKQADEKSEKIIPALFYEMFADPTKTNSQVKIKDLITDVEQKDFRRFSEVTFKYVDISSVDGNIGKIISYTNLSGANAPSRAKQVIKYKDVIISTVRPYLRATALVPKDLDNQVCSTGFCVLRTKADYGFGFLYALSRLNWFSEKLMTIAKGASYPAVSDSDILNMSIPYPTQKELLIKKFDDIIINLELKRDSREQANKRIQNLFDLLLSKAFDGSLTASWREANMKELLQEMEEQKKYLEGKINA